jgi:tetratricopeptide (TPR) repeat protein
LTVAPDEVDATRFEALVAEGLEALEDDDPQWAEERFRDALTMWRGDPLGDLAREPFARAKAAHLRALWQVAALGHVEAILDLGNPRAAAAELERLLEVAVGGPAGHDVIRGEARPPLVGRQRELARLEELLDEARSGERRVVVLAGEAGVGKSRLVAELVSRAGSTGAIVAVGHAHPGQGAPPYWPWAQALRALVSSLPEETVAAAFAPHGSLVARLVPHAGAILPRTPDENELLPASTARARLAEAVTSGLGRIAGQVPVVLVLEDLDRADPASLFMLRYLVASPPVGSLLVVGTYRTREPKPEVARLLSAFRGRRSLAWTEVDGLGDSGVGELLGAHGFPTLRREEVAAIAKRTGGNPLLIEAAAQAMRRAGTDGPARLPSTAVGLLEQNLAALPPATLRLLEVAAVMGEHVDLPMLESTVGDSVRNVVAAIERRVLVASEESGSSLRFRHERLRTTIYEQIEPARCAELHGAVGVVLRDSGRRPADEVAEHLWRAVDGGRREYADQAVGAAFAAADAALEMSSVEQAAAHLERATVLLAGEARPDVRSAREVQLGVRWVRLHELDKGLLASEIAAAVQRIWGAARGPAVEDEMAATGRAGWTHYVLRGELSRARALAEDLVHRGTEGGEPGSLAVGLVGLGHLHFLSGEPAAALAALERGVEIAEADDPSSEFLRRDRVRARAFLVPVLEMRGESSRARELLDAASASAERPDDAIEVRVSAALAGVIAGDPRRTLVAALEAEDVALSSSLGFYVPLARALRAWAAVRLGDPSAEWSLDEAMQQLDAMDFRWLRAVRLGLQADATVVARGALDAGLEHIDNALGEAAMTGEHVYEPELHRFRAELLAAIGQPAEAEAALARALDSARVSGASVFEERIHTTARSLDLPTAH